ncbi:uncharacterized protein LOC135336770 [Halichondria panicea]|uniref:uncharacterized protein LOC135336770 n=1 Tax=Halichondria panicea TaxID=6063 RepID=UPI00312BAB89
MAAALLQSFGSQQLQLSRCLSTSTSWLMKRPVFEGPAYPKRPAGPYLLFVKETLPSIPSSSETDHTESIKNTDIFKQVGVKWHALTAAEKQIYGNRSSELRKLHKNEVTRFMDSLGDKEAQEKYLQDLTEYRRKRRDYVKHFRLKKMELVKPGSISGYNVFMKEFRNDFIQGNNPESLKEGLKALCEKWKELSDEEKASYNVKGKDMHTERLIEYEKKYKQAIEEGIVKPPKEKKEPAKKKKKVSKKATTKEAKVSTKTSLEQTA